MIRKFCQTLFAAAAAVLPASAQSAMSLHDCMAYAVSHSTRMRILEADASDARIERRNAALALFTPQISATTYAYYNFGRSIDPQTNTYFTQTSFHNNYGISAGYELFDGFRAVNNLKISMTGLLISESEQKQAEADICLAVMEAYCNAVYYKRLADIYEELAALAETVLRKARREEELGLKSHADVVQTEAELAERRYESANACNSWRSHLTTLSDLMFWPLDHELVIDSGLPPIEPEPVSAGSVTDFALTNAPALLIAGYRTENARRELSTAKGQLLPSVGLYAGWNTSCYTYAGALTEPFARQFRNNGGEYVQLSISVPLYSRLLAHSRVSLKRNALTRAQAEYDRKRRDVETEVRRAVQDRDGAAFAYDCAQRKAEVQDEAYRLHLKKLEQGLISPLEFQTASGNFLKAKADEMHSLLTYFIRQAVVRYYSGIDYLDQN